MRTRVQDYTVGWVCAIPTEYVAACELLDYEFGRDEAPLYDSNHDSNTYTFGRIYDHLVVIACLPKGQYGITSAALVGERLFRSFSGVQLRLMVGIAGGAPSHRHDIRLGDVVVSCPQATHTGVLQYDYGKAIQNKEFQVTGHLASPPQRLLTALSSIISRHERKGHNIADTIARMLVKNRRLQANYARPDPKLDRLYRSSFIHSNDGKCDCELPASAASSHSSLVTRVKRQPDDDTSVIHYGLVASANQLMKDANARDALIRQHDVLCFEMEAAGLMNDLPCIVIRGICDYSDTHKNDHWQGYAAAVAAAYAKELLEIIPGLSSLTQSSTETDSHQGMHSGFVPDQTALLEQADCAIRDFYTSSGRLKIERLSGEALPLDKCYINLLLQQRSGKSSDEAHAQPITLKRRLEVQDAVENESIKINEIFSPRRFSDSTYVEPRRIFIQGRAGIGKTTLCKKIAFEFLQNRLGSGLFDRLLWFSLRSLDSNNARYSWSELLHDAFPLSGQVAGWEDLVVVLSKHLSKPKVRHKTLFLLDGLDEVSRNWKHDDKNFQFLENMIYNAPNLIITSRPQAKSLKIGDFDLELEATGFTREQIDTYIEHCVKDEQAMSAMKKSIVSKPFLQDLLRIPVQLDAFCCTWNMDGSNQDESRAENVTTMTSLYQEIMTELCWKDLIRTGRCDKRDRMAASGIPSLLKEELNLIELFAFQGFINNVIEFTPRHQEQIDAYQRRRGVPLPPGQNAALEELSFIRTSDHQLHHRKRNYHFMHLTYQEFFAARYFVERWKSNRKLTCLGLEDSTISSRTRILPTVLLLREKYNPRFAIFWRFVAGLTLIQEMDETRSKTSSGTAVQNVDRNGVITFFELLNDNPRDLLKAQHSRLLMYCLSEVTSYSTRAIRSMRANIEERLHATLLVEWRITKEIASALAVDFPETVLRKLLRESRYIPWFKVLAVLRSRTFLTTESLHAILETIPRDAEIGLRVQVVQAIFDHSDLHAESFNEPLERAIEIFRAMLHDRDEEVRMTALKWNRPLPSTLMRELLQMFSTSKERRIQQMILQTLRHQHSLSLEVATILLPALDHKDSHIWEWALTAMEWPSQVPQEVLLFLARALYHKSTNIRIASAELLSKDPLLPEASINGLISLLQDTDQRVRYKAIYALSSQTRLSQEIITTCFEIHDESAEVLANATRLILLRRSPSELTELIISNKLLRHEVPSIRETALRFLPRRNGLPDKLLMELATMLKDKDWEFRQTASSILRSQLQLPQTCLTFLVVLLRDEDPEIRRCALRLFGGRADLVPKDIRLLITLLHDQDYRIREDAAVALGKQSSLADPTIQALTTAIEDEVYAVRLAAITALTFVPNLDWQCIDLLLSVFMHEDFNLRKSATKVLMNQTSFSKRTRDTLITVLSSEDPYVRESASRILCAQSALPGEAIQALVSMFQQNEYQNQFAITVLAGHFSQPREKIVAILGDLKNRTLNVRCAAIESLASKAPQFQSSISLVSWLSDVDDSIRRMAFHVLTERSNLPEEASLALVALLDSKDYELSQNAGQLLKKHTPLSESTLTQLISLLEDEDEVMRLRATSVLENHPNLPRNTIKTLLKLLEKKHQRMVTKGKVYLRLHATRLFSAQINLPREVLKFLVHILIDDPDIVYSVLHRNNIYSMLKDLGDEEWSKMLSFWCGHTFSPRYEFCIYALDSTLCIWSDGTLHQVSLGKERVKVFSQLVKRIQREDLYIIPQDFYRVKRRQEEKTPKRLAITSG